MTTISSGISLRQIMLCIKVCFITLNSLNWSMIARLYIASQTVIVTEAIPLQAIMKKTTEVLNQLCRAPSAILIMWLIR